MKARILNMFCILTGLGILLSLSGFDKVSYALQQSNVRDEFTPLMESISVQLYKNAVTENQFVQVVSLDKGATIKLPYGTIVDSGIGAGDYGGNDPSFRRQSLQGFWNDFEHSDGKAFCITNGEFFADRIGNQIIDPTHLAFSLKKDGVYVSDGYAVEGTNREYDGQRLMLELWTDGADIIPLTKDNFYHSSAPNIIAGLTWDANKGPTDLVGRTFVGVTNQNSSGNYAEVLIYNSSSSTQGRAKTVLESFGANKIMMLDGGASTQLICRGQTEPLIASSRSIPQALAVSSTQNVNATAQAGVTWLGQEAVNWQNRNGCIGCHVQPKAIQAAAIAKDNGFTIDTSSLTSLLNFMKSRQTVQGDFGDWPIGEEHHAAPGFAAYDRIVSNDSQANMISLANWFVSQQYPDGHWAIDRYEPPVDQGDIMVTANAVTILAQAYNRTQNPSFSTSMQLGAQWLAVQTGNALTTQDKAHIIIGLVATGRTISDPAIQLMVNQLKSEQLADKGWADTGGQSSTAYGTGQVLYALRLAGVRLDDPVMTSGVNWLINNQESTGSWPLTDNSDPGRRSQFSPTMWGVLGLVQSVDLTPPTLVPPILPVHVPKWVSLSISIFDNILGSGINPVSIIVRLDGVVVPSFYIPILNKVIVFVDPEQTHTITVDATDNQGNPAPQLVFTFTVDTSLFGVQSTSPANGSINVPVDVTFEALFNGPIDGSTINQTTVTLSDQNDQQIAGEIAIDPSTNKVSFQSIMPLDFQSYYVLTIHGGGDGVHAADGQPMVTDYQFGFRTRAESGDITPPTVTAVDRQVDGSIQIQFSEPMDALTVNGSTVLLKDKNTGIGVPSTLSFDSATYRAVLAPLSPLELGKIYELRVLGSLGGVTDLSGNPMDQDYVTDLGSRTNQPPELHDAQAVELQYSDSVSFDISANDPDNLGSELVFSVLNLPNTLTLIDHHDGTATIAGIASVAPETYLAQITVTDPGGLSATKPVNIVVTQEDARTVYTGPSMVSTSCATCTAATVPLRATIQDISAVFGDPAFDSEAGDITNATVSFVNRNNADTVLCTANVTLLDPANPTVGTATCNWTPNIGSSYGLDYTIGMNVYGYYTRNSVADDFVVVVSKPTSNFITGGGYFINQSSAGIYAGDTGLKTNFGLNIKFTQRLTNLQGRVTIILRQGGHVYQIKSTALSSLVAVPYTPANLQSGTAELSGKATVIDITDPLNPVTVAGNARLNIKMKDRGELGSADSLGISLWSSNGRLLFSNNWDGRQTLLQLLGGGNISIK